MMKRYSKCGEVNKLTSFYRLSSSKDEHWSDCKECCKKQKTKFTEENLIKYRCNLMVTGILDLNGGIILKLLVLTQNNCRYCEQVKTYLNNREVEYNVINMSEQPEYQEKYDIMGAPTILLLDEDEIIAKTTGFNPSVLETFIEQL